MIIYSERINAMNKVWRLQVEMLRNPRWRNVNTPASVTTSVELSEVQKRIYEAAFDSNP